MALKTFELPSSVSHFRLVWEVTSGGTEPSNSTPIPSVLSKRWAFIKCVNGGGTLTLEGGWHVPESPEGVFWDTVLSQNVSDGTAILQSLTHPYHFYRVVFTVSQGYSGAIRIYVVVEGNAE